MEYKDFAIGLAKVAGEIIRKNFVIGMKKEWKADNSPVTETDLAINSMVIDRVQKYFPDHGVKGEEQSLFGDRECLWVCDPLDGTIPFCSGVPTCTFSIALVKDGVPLLGVVYDPFIDRMFCAEKGKGAFLNNEIIRVLDDTNMKGNSIDLSTWPAAKYNLALLQGEIAILGPKIFKSCALIYTSSLVACGGFIATIFGVHSTHDVAAIKVIVEEAGGKVTDLFGNEQRYDQDIKGAIISNGRIHDQLVKIVGKILKKG